MKYDWLNEDKWIPKLLVSFSPKIIDEINAIDEYNQNNIKALSQWYEYIDWVKKYISNPSIAYDYANRYRRLPNGAIYNNDLGYNIAYTIIVNKNTSQPCVYVFMINLKPEEFGLEVPSTIYENAMGKRIHSLIHEYVSSRNPLTESVRKSVRMNERELCDMVGSIARRIVCEEYKVVGYDEDFDFGNGKTGHSLLTHFGRARNVTCC